MRGLRLQLASLFLLVVMPGLVAAITYNYFLYSDTRAAEAERLLSRARLLGAPNGVLLDGVANLLGDLAKRKEIRNAATAPDLCAETLANVGAIHPELGQIAVFTPAGDLVCANPGGDAAPNDNERARPWFKHVLTTRQLTIGEYRARTGAGAGTIEVGYPMRSGDGSLSGVIGAALDIGWLSERFAQIALEKGVVLTLFDGDGTALARYPDPDRLTGQRLGFVAERIAASAAGTDEKEFLDHTTRVAAFAPLGGKDWHDLTVSIDVDPAVLLASARWNLALDLASLSSVVLMGAFAAFHYGGKLFLRPIAEIGSVAARLSAGDMAARVGGPYTRNELGGVARAFDGMAEALCARDRELRRANAYKSRMLAIAGHDLRQPLQVVTMSHELIGRALTSPKLQQQLARADQAIARLLRQLDIMTWAGQLDDRAPEPTVEAVPLGPLLSESAAEQASLAEDKGVTLKVVGTSAVAVTDAEMLRTILRNLIGNAVKYTRRGGVLVGCRRTDDAIAVDVCDTGIGIPEDRIESVFDEFYQLDPKGAGMGLGLSIVRRTAELLGHRIEVRSALGRGSRFRLVVPRAEAQAKRTEARSA